MIKNVVETSIAASPGDVFSIVCDFEHYPEWNPFTPRVIGRCEPGALVEVTVQLLGKPFRMKRRVKEVVPGRRFSWEGAAWYSRLIPGLRAVNCLDDGQGGTRLVDDEWLGGLTFLMSAAMVATIRGQMVAFGEALRARAERGRPGPPPGAAA